MGDTLEKVLLDSDLILSPIDVWVSILKSGFVENNIILA